MKRKLLSIILCLAMALSLLPTAALADEGETAKPVKVGETGFETLEAAIADAEPVNGVITYEITGKVDVTATGWVQVAKTGLTTLTKVEFIGKTEDAEICITGGVAILADKSYDIDVSFENLILSKQNPTYANDYGHSTKYFTCWLRNTNAGENTVTYTDCTFPDGACNNQYGKTVFDNCKFTNRASGMYNLWNYGGNTEIKNSEFTGTRGIKAYSEGTDGGDITVADTTFTSLTEKAAIIASKPVGIVVEDISVSGDKGFITRDITGNDEVELKVSGTGISGNFNITSNTNAEEAKSEFNITAGTFTGTLDTGYLAPGATINENGTVEMNPVAKVGTGRYTTLEAAFAALDSTDYKLELLGEESVQKAVWPENTPVYWKAGDQSKYAATLAVALTAAYKAGPSDDITIVCRPGADVGTMTHGHVADNLTIYGNNAYISDGECDLEVDTYKFSRATGAQANDGAYLNKNITITAYELDNLGVWGQRHTDYTVNINLTDCDGKAIEGKDNLQRVYISNPVGENNITLINCDFLTKATAVYSNADGEVTIKSCSFTGSQVPVNINHKAGGTQKVMVMNSTFTNCGDNDSWKQFAAPIRFVNSGSGTMSANVSDCTITGTKGTNGDILLGDGRTGEKSNNLELKVSGTAANVQAQKPGYYKGESTVASKKAEKELTPAESLHTTIADLLPVTEVDLDEFIKLVTSAGYSFDGSSVAGTGKKLTVKWSPVSGCFDLNGGHHQLDVDCPKSAATGNTPNRLQDPYAQYQLFASATGLSISNVNFVYVPEKVSVCMNGTWGGKDVTPTLAELQLNNSGDTSFAGCTFDKVTVSPYGKGNNNGNTNEQNNASFTGCEFANVTDKYAIKDVYAGNVTVENCTFNNCGGGIYLEGNAKKGTIDISDNNFTNIGTKGLIQFSANGDYTNADIILDGNTATNCGPILRQLNQGIANNDVLSKNLKGDLTGLGGELTFTGDSVKKTSGEEPSQPTIYTVKFSGSDVADKKVVSGTVITLPTPTKSGYTFNGWYDGSTKVSSPYEVRKDVTLTASWSYNYSGGSSYDPTYSVSTPSKTENGSVTVSPKSASKGDTVTVTVKPDSGYVLETLTVTDKNGNELTLKDKGNGKYTFTMPAGKVEVKATFMEDNSMLNFFYDVPNNAYFYEAVKWAVKNGITDGVGNNLFAPEQPCTRAQIVTFLWRAAGSPEPKGAASGMTDVVSGSYYEKAVAWAIENGITTGTTTSTFSPDATCTRAQAVTFLARALKAKAASAAEFSDVPTDSYFADAVAWAAANGVTEGVGGGLFAPDNDCTRGQIVTFLYRAYNK